MLPYTEISKLNFLEVMIAIVVSWIIIDLWLRVIENFAYRTIGLSEKSTIHTLIVALVVTIIFIAFVFSVPDSITDLIIGESYSEEDLYGGESSGEQTNGNKNLSTYSGMGNAINRSAGVSGLGNIVINDLSNIPMDNLRLPHVIDPNQRGKFPSVEPDIRRGNRLVHRSIYNNGVSKDEHSIDRDIFISRNIPTNDRSSHGSEYRRYRRITSGDNGGSFLYSYPVAYGAN